MRPAVMISMIFAAFAVAAPAQDPSEAIQSTDEAIDKEWTSVFEDITIDDKCKPAYYPCVLVSLHIPITDDTCFESP
ncbi:hypothetical protein N7528_004187 [Penicillium herquei]|nr:hypothetical protein N7528_004187 [Penicillium herquei]